MRSLFEPVEVLISTLYAVGEIPEPPVPVPPSFELKESQPTFDDQAQPDRGWGFAHVGTNDAVTVVLPVIVSVQGLEVPKQPLAQSTKLEPAEKLAVNVATVPLSTVLAQAVCPHMALTAPAPVPDEASERE